MPSPTFNKKACNKFRCEFYLFQSRISPLCYPKERCHALASCWQIAALVMVQLRAERALLFKGKAPWDYQGALDGCGNHRGDACYPS